MLLLLILLWLLLWLILLLLILLLILLLLRDARVTSKKSRKHVAHATKKSIRLIRIISSHHSNRIVPRLRRTYASCRVSN